MLHQRRRHPEPLDALKDRCEQLTRHRHFRHLEHHLPSVADYLRTDLDQLIP